ncbi:unnamed protein product, partial [Vitis vinifera]
MERKAKTWRSIERTYRKISPLPIQIPQQNQQTIQASIFMASLSTAFFRKLKALTQEPSSKKAFDFDENEGCHGCIYIAEY